MRTTRFRFWKPKPEMDVKPELSRVQRNQLKTTLYGKGASSPSSSHHPQTPYLPIYRLHEVDAKEAFRVSYPQIESMKKQQRNSMEKGEDKLKDLQNALGNKANIPCPDEIQLVEDLRYNKMYPEAYKTSEDGLESEPPFKLIRTSRGESDDSEISDYDMDDDDEKFLEKHIKTNYNFNVSKTVFEQVIRILQNMKLKGKQDLKLLCEELQKTKQYPKSLLSITELEIIASYFLEKSKLQDIPWQPSHRRRANSTSPQKKRRSSGSSPPKRIPLPYQVFRAPPPRIEPKFLRSQKQVVSLSAADDLHKRAINFSNMLKHYMEMGKAQRTSGIEQRTRIVMKLRAMEELWKNGGGSGENLVTDGKLNTQENATPKSAAVNFKIPYVSLNRVGEPDTFKDCLNSPKMPRLSTIIPSWNQITSSKGFQGLPLTPVTVGNSENIVSPISTLEDLHEVLKTLEFSSETNKENNAGAGGRP